MSTLSHAFPFVQPIQIVALPEIADHGDWKPSDEPFHVSPDHLAYDTGFTIGLEDGRFDYPSSWSPSRKDRYELGRLHGRREREAREARQLGESLGYLDGPTEPPAGFAPHEARAFREGFRAGLERFEHEREYNAYLDELAAAAYEAENRITDADIYPLGCVS